MSRLTTFAATLIVALAAFPIQAQQFDAGAYCNHLAGYAEAVAKDRDSGTPEYIALDIASGIEHPVFRGDAIWLVQFVHAGPAIGPDYAASAAFDLCWEVYGESA